MKRIGLLSDTHGYLDGSIFSYFENCDEVWHAGDIGNSEVADKLEAFRPFRAVYGNIDDKTIQTRYPLNQEFVVEGLAVWITHIAGYPEKYVARVKNQLLSHPVGLFICGHSHILKIMRDAQLGHIHINPGACGHEGFHKVRTIVRFAVLEGKLFDLEVIELGKRGVY